MMNEVCHYCLTENIPGYTNCKGCGKLKRDIKIDKERAYSSALLTIIGFAIAVVASINYDKLFDYEYNEYGLFKGTTYSVDTAKMLAGMLGFFLAFAIAMFMLTIYYFKRVNKKMRI